MKNFIKSLLVAASLSSSVFAAASESQNFERFTNLQKSISSDKPLTVVLTNDTFTDPDSIHSFVDFIAHLQAMLGTRASSINIIAVTDDEYRKEDMQDLLDMPEHPYIKGEIKAHIAEYIQKAPFDRGLRAIDTAVVLGSLINHLNDDRIKLTVVEGERTVQDTRGIKYINPYFGNFGADYTSEDVAHIEAIHPEIGSKAVIKMLEEADKAGHDLYVINGGSMQFNLDMVNQAPELARRIQAISAIGYVTGSEKPGERPRTSGSWNQQLNLEVSDAFFNNPAYKIHINVDSFCNKASPTCDGLGATSLPVYHTFLEDYGYTTFLSPEAIATLETVDKNHTIFAFNMKAKMMDSMAFLYALGEVTLPMHEAKFRYDQTIHRFVPDSETGLELAFPMLLDGTHPLLSESAFNDMNQTMIKLIGKTRDILKTAK